MNSRLLTAGMAWVLAAWAPSAGAISIWNVPVNTTNYWTNSAAWTGGLPGSADDVVFTNARGVCILDQNTACGNLTIHSNYASTIQFLTGAVASLTVNGDLLLGTNSTLLCTWTSTDTNGLGTGRVVTVTGNATINGKLSATYQGFTNNAYPSVSAGRGSHGGRGAGAPYGSVTNPVELGGGGWVPPSDGGGAIKLTVTSNLTVNGSIEANGCDANIGGAGGSLWITCYSLSGNGAIRADGGKGVSQGNNGTGGRIALYHTNSTFSGPISAAGYQAGTLWEPGKFPTGAATNPATVTITEAGFRYTFPDSTVTNFWSLTISNSALLTRTMSGVEFYGGRLVISNLDQRGDLRFDYNDARDGGKVTFSSMSNLLISGAVTVRQGILTLPAQGTYSNITTLTVSNGATLVAGSDVTAVNQDSSGSAVVTQGVGVVMYCQSALINGTISGNALGWGVWDPKAPLRGAHGGVRYNAAAGERPYGNLTRPSCPGACSSVAQNNFGGGAFGLLAAGDVTLNGTATCGGSQGPGGSVRIACGNFSGTGTVSAVGDYHWDTAGQGGGRIALEYTNSTFTGQLKADSTGKLGSVTNIGSKGTIFRCTSPQAGLVSFISSGIKVDSTFSVNGGYASAGTTNGLLVTRSIANWNTNAASPRFTWTDSCTTLSNEPVNNVVTYTLTGVPTQTVFNVYADSALLYATNSGASGVIGVTNISLLTSRTLDLLPPAAGLIAPNVRTDPPTNVASTSASLNGYLTATGDCATTPSVYWGPSDGRTNAGAWASNIVFAAPQPVGPLFTNLPVTPGAECFYRYAASNAAGFAWATDPSGYLLTTGLTVTVSPASVGENNETATFRIARPATATSMPLTVFYTVGGDASNGVDYQPIGTSTVIAAGATNADITVTTIRDALADNGETLTLTLLPAAYPIGQPGAATLTVTDAPAASITTVWSSSLPANWTNPAAWSAGVPLAIDDAVFTNTGRGTAVISSDVACRNLIVSSNYAGTITFVTGTVAGLTVNGDLLLGTNCTLLCPYTSTNGYGTGRVVNVAGNAVIQGKLSASGQGFASDTYPGGITYYGSHGGYGSGNSLPYGSLTNPVTLGGGGHGDSAGGAIKLTVGGNLAVSGSIEANGRSSNIGGAGGSLWITCASLSGSGEIRADGGAGNASLANNSGAGGRIALYYTNSTFTGPISAAGTQAGTLWEPLKFPAGTPASPANVTISEAGFQYLFPASSITNYWNLTVTNSGLLSRGQGGVAFYGGNLVVSNLDVSGWLRFDYRAAQMEATVNSLSMSNLALCGNVTLRQGALWLPAQPQALYSNIGILAVATGSTVYCGADLSVTNEDSGGTGSARHGAGVVIRCRTAAINGTVSGFALGWGPSASGPLAGAHGGVKYGAAAGDRPYGNLTRPTAPGANSSGNHGSGGGAFSLYADGDLTLNGTINCAGSAAPGGSVRLSCGSLGGTGTVSVVGDCDSGIVGQGGGRAAIEFTNSTFTGQILANSTAPNIGSRGTIFLCTSPQPGLVTFTASAVKLDTSFSINGGYPSAGTTNGLRVTRTVTKWRTEPLIVRWTDACSTLTSETVTNLATYTLSGLTPRTMVTVLSNSVIMFSTNSGAAGSVVISNVNLSTSPEISVESGARGSVFKIR